MLPFSFTSRANQSANLGRLAHQQSQQNSSLSWDLDTMRVLRLIFGDKRLEGIYVDLMSVL
jgi:hypothetical protein